MNGVAEARDAIGFGDAFLRTGGRKAGGIAAAEVVHDGSVGPVGLDTSIGVVHALETQKINSKVTNK